MNASVNQCPSIKLDELETENIEEKMQPLPVSMKKDAGIVQISEILATSNKYSSAIASTRKGICDDYIKRQTINSYRTGQYSSYRSRSLVDPEKHIEDKWQC